MDYSKDDGGVLWLILISQRVIKKLMLMQLMKIAYIFYNP